MEYINKEVCRAPVRAVLFDFDGTISTLRYGWEGVMRPLMLEYISGGAPVSAELEREVDDYINESTGIQTILQMKWLAQRVHNGGSNPEAPTDPWFYKGEYNRRLMARVSDRVHAVKLNSQSRDEYLMMGIVELLEALACHDVDMYVASGTDDPDVYAEADALGVAKYFKMIVGSPVGAEACSKERVIERLMQDEGLRGDDFAVIGDGKVEVRLGCKAGARTLGIASDEDKRSGINTVKRERLIAAGADAIVGDFTDLDGILTFLGIKI